MLKHIKKMHFIGIGGVGVSAIARMARLKDIRVAGSDLLINKMAERIKLIGGKIFIGHKKENLAKNTDLVVYSPAITEDNPELIYAKELNIPIYSYPEVLGLISKDMYTIAVSGAHGKTTTTSMIAELMIYGNLDPTVVVGGLLKKQEDNFVLGQSKYFVVEACEYKESFLNLTPDILVVLNIDNDHLDYYGNIENIQNAFAKIIAKTKEYIVCDLNDENIVAAIKKAEKINQLAQIVDYSEEEADIKLSIPGEHNLKNAQAAFDAAKLCGIEEKTALKILKNYIGTWRRFEFMGNTEKGALLFNDYGHHPTEIQATLKACKEQYPNHKLIVVFQPHLYSRTRLLLNDFAISFNLADKVIITDIYAAREKDEHKIHAKDLVETINKKIRLNGGQACLAKYISSFEEIKNYLQNNNNKDNLILFLGAGDVYKIGELLISGSNRHQQ